MEEFIADEMQAAMTEESKELEKRYDLMLEELRNHSRKQRLKPLYDLIQQWETRRMKSLANARNWTDCTNKATQGNRAYGTTYAYERCIKELKEALESEEMQQL